MDLGERSPQHQQQQPSLVIIKSSSSSSSSSSLELDGRKEDRMMELGGIGRGEGVC